MEVEVGFVELLQFRHINLVLEFGDTEILDLDGVGHGELKANGHGWQIVRVLDESELGTSVEGLTLEAET